MNIALIAHDKKKELMVQFCIAYSGILSKHSLYATGTDTDKLLEGVTAYDSHDGDVTASLLIEKVTETGNGEVIVTYAAMDSSNNVAELSRILKTAGHPASDPED